MLECLFVESIIVALSILSTLLLSLSYDSYTHLSLAMNASLNYFGKVPG